MESWLKRGKGSIKFVLTALMPENCWASIKATEMKRGALNVGSLRICRRDILSPPSFFIISISSWTSKSPLSQVKTVDKTILIYNSAM